jgi:hypothetical protein
MEAFLKGLDCDVWTPEKDGWKGDFFFSFFFFFLGGFGLFRCCWLSFCFRLNFPSAIQSAHIAHERVCGEQN